MRLRYFVFGLTVELPYYSCLGIEQKLALDTVELQKRFYEKSREWHPDRFARAPTTAQQEALEKTALLNDAFRTLRDPLARAEYVLKAHGFDIGEQGTKNVPPELLEEVFELNMALEDKSDRATLERFQQDFRGMLQAIDGELGGLYAGWDSGGGIEKLRQVRGVLNRRRYIQNLLKTVEQALV